MHRAVRRRRRNGRAEENKPDFLKNDNGVAKFSKLTLI